MEKSFRFGAEIVKAEENSDGDYIFEGIASLPGRDLEGEETVPEGLEIDYLLGHGLPGGAGGYINYDHDPSTIVGVPLDGKITKQGFWLKWKALKTPFMKKVIEQMQALKKAGWPRRYGMSIEGIVQQYDPHDPTRILRAFIRNVALTPTPVHPGTFVDFAKSLAAGATVQYRPQEGLRNAISAWASLVVGIQTGKVIVKSNNPYFHEDGTFKQDQDVAYFENVHQLAQHEALECARYALSREHLIQKSLEKQLQKLTTGSRGHPATQIQEHLRDFKKRNPDCPHVNDDGTIRGGLRDAARHFLLCERRPPREVEGILSVLAHPHARKEELR